MQQHEEELQGNINKIVYAVCEELTEQEVVALTTGLMFDNFHDGLLGYDKLKPLMQGGKMHEMTRKALEVALSARFDEL